MRGCSGTDVPTHISLRELYGEEGLRSLDDADVKVSDLPTYGEGSRDDVMQDAPHQGQGEAPRPGATECGQSPMETDNTHDHDTHMFDDETDARGSSPGARVPQQSGARQSGSRRHHAVSEPGSAILDIYAVTAEEIIEKAQAHLSRKERRKQQRRCKLDAAQQKERTRIANTPSKETLLRAAMAGDEPHLHCSNCDKTFDTDEARRRYPLAVPMKTLCEPCAGKPEVLVEMGLVASAQLIRPGDTELPFEWEKDRALIVSARCPRCHSHYTNGANNTARNQLEAFGVAVTFELLWVDDGGMRKVKGNRFVHWSCELCAASQKENGEVENCEVPCTVAAAAADGLWPVVAYIQPGSKDVDGPLMHDDTMVFCNRPRAAFLARLRVCGRMSFECLHLSLRASTQDSGRDDFKLSKRMRGLLLRSLALLRSVDKQLRHRVKDELRDLQLNSCLICSKLDDRVLNPTELGGCCGICIDCTLKGASRNGLKSEPSAVFEDDSMAKALREGHLLLIPQSDLQFSEQLTKDVQERAQVAAAAARAAVAAQAAAARAPTADDADVASHGGGDAGGQSAADGTAAADVARPAAGGRADTAASAAADGADGQAAASGEGCPLGERFHSFHSPNMTPGIDAKKEDQKPKRTTGIGVCTHLFIMMAGLLVSAKNECYLLIQTLAEEIVFHESFHPIKISDPAWPEALRGKEYLFAYYDIACRHVLSPTLRGLCSRAMSSPRRDFDRSQVRHRVFVALDGPTKSNAAAQFLHEMEVGCRRLSR